jgi:DNA polymerase epsilon subunit 1
LTTEFDTDLDEMVTCSAAFKKLKDLVSRWLEDAVQQDDACAQNLISNVYRWLSSSKVSKLYDPLLHRLVHKLMTKNFYLLLRRFKQLGCKVIYASFHEIWVYTEKRTFTDAESQINFVLNDIKQNDLFQYCNIEMEEAWKILLFKDRYNYGGIKESLDNKVSTKWDIVNHLPEITRRAYNLIASEYIHKVYRYNLDLDKKREINQELGFEDQDA